MANPKNLIKRSLLSEYIHTHTHTIVQYTYIHTTSIEHRSILLILLEIVCSIHRFAALEIIIVIIELIWYRRYDGVGWKHILTITRTPRLASIESMSMSILSNLRPHITNFYKYISICCMPSLHNKFALTLMRNYSIKYIRFYVHMRENPLSTIVPYPAPNKK